MYIVKMERNCLGDTRTATHMPTREEFEEANESHCDDVAGLVGAFCTELFNRAQDHDWTKLVEPYATMFYNEMKSTIEEHREFTGGEWYRLHSMVLERHHLLERCPEDVTLFDVIEMLCDCVAAGMARTGHVYPIVLPDEILQKAVSNTVDYLVKHIEVVDSKTENCSDSCEHITEDGVTCAKYPACDDCPDNPLNKVKGFERLVKGLDNCELHTETKTETKNSNLTFEKRTMRDCYNCKKYETEDECIECHYEPKDEPQTDCPQSAICGKPCKECGACEKECGMWDILKTEQTERSE